MGRSWLSPPPPLSLSLSLSLAREPLRERGMRAPPADAV